MTMLLQTIGLELSVIQLLRMLGGIIFYLSLRLNAILEGKTILDYKNFSPIRIACWKFMLETYDEPIRINVNTLYYAMSLYLNDESNFQKVLQVES